MAGPEPKAAAWAAFARKWCPEEQHHWQTPAHPEHLEQWGWSISKGSVRLSGMNPGRCPTAPLPSPALCLVSQDPHRHPLSLWKPGEMGWWLGSPRSLGVCESPERAQKWDQKWESRSQEPWGMGWTSWGGDAMGNRFLSVCRSPCL